MLYIQLAQTSKRKQVQSSLNTFFGGKQDRKSNTTPTTPAAASIKKTQKLIGIIWDHILLIHSTITKTAQIISELIAVYVKIGKIKRQPLALGALGKQCELWLVDGYR